jgi:hypothetical protein
LNESEIYISIRNEIINNHTLMHLFSVIVIVIILIGTLIVESRKTILSIFLPLLTLGWAAAMVRFDFFIHRQNAYLRVIEPELQSKGINIPLWESWRQSLISTPFILPITDFIIFTIIVFPTIYILFGPAQEFFRYKKWNWGKVYAWTVLTLTVLFLGVIAFIPKMAEWRT